MSIVFVILYIKSAQEKMWIWKVHDSGTGYDNIDGVNVLTQFVLLLDSVATEEVS